MQYVLDDIDRKILRLIQQDCKRTSTDIAQMVGLSQTPCLRRIKNMETSGIIERYTAVLNPDAMGLGMTFFTRVWLTGQDEATVEPFTKAVGRLPNVVECHLMAGDCDFLLRILAANIEAYRQFQIEHLNSLPGIQSVKTEIPMQRIKYSSDIPI